MVLGYLGTSQGGQTVLFLSAVVHHHQGVDMPRPFDPAGLYIKCDLRAAGLQELLYILARITLQTRDKKDPSVMVSPVWGLLKTVK